FRAHGGSMLDREAGIYRSSYAADMAIFPLALDRIVVGVVVVIAFGVIPFVASGYLLKGLLIPTLAYALAAIGLNILTGYAGQLSLGHAAFMAVGAYGAVIAYGRYGWPLLLSFLVGGLAAPPVGVLTVFAKTLVRTRVGRAWMAIRDRDVAAEIMGIGLLRYKMLAFVVSSFYAGVAGALISFCFYQAANIEEYTLTISIRVLG